MSVDLPVQASAIPGRLYESAGSFKRRKSMPHPSPTSDPTYTSSLLKGSISLGSTGQIARLSGPVSLPLNGYDSPLPPTPPRHSDGTAPTKSQYINSPKQAGGHLLVRKRPDHRIVTKGQSPFTPESSPRIGDYLSLPISNSANAVSPSSRADSFRTAKEFFSDDDEDIPELSPSLKGAVKPVRQLSQEDGLGLDFERDDDSTPTPKKRQLKQEQSSPAQAPLNEAHDIEIDTIPDREWDTNLMRNVTVRRKKRPLLDRSKVEEDEERIVAREIVPKLINGSSEDDDLSEPNTPKHEHFEQTNALPQPAKHDEQHKRLSSSSHNSNVLEAIIVATPPRRRQTLRHVSKNLSLRSISCSSITGAPTPSREGSLASDDMALRQLSSTLRAEDINRANGRVTPENNFSQPTIPLRHHPENRSLRANSTGDWSPRRASDGEHSSTTTSLPQNRAISGGNASSHSRMSAGPVLDKRQPRAEPSEPANVKYDTAPKSQRPFSTMSWRDESTRAATRRALKQIDSMASADFPLRPTSSSRTTPPAFPISVVPVIKAPATHDSISAPLRSGEGEDLHLIKTTTSAGSQDGASSLQPRSTFESMPRVSFDESLNAGHDMRRASLASSSLQPDAEHAMARHLYAQTTPFSQTSELHEISEATTVSLFPHNNASLLVVQQIGRNSAAQRDSLDEDSAVLQPILTVQPATPPQKSNLTINVDSPLKNPRKPPQPPASSALVAPVINILPATPDQELDRLSLYEIPQSNEKEASNPPMRSLSLVQRARRYSDTVMRPIMIRTSSLRRSHYGRPRHGRRGAPRDRHSTPVSNLHPLWQPRGFWDDFSDSDSEFGDSGGPRLPVGGDTTELGEPRGFRKVVDNLRREGGFHIGNSLGLERAGTNHRKPSFDVPVGLGRRPSSHVLRRTSHGILRPIGSSSTTNPGRSNARTSSSSSSSPSAATTTARNLRTANALARQSIESLRCRTAEPSKLHAWNPLNWQMQYVGVGGVRDVLRERKAEKRRRELKNKIGVRYSVEDAPLAN